jgi:hypothetical protein
MTMTKPKPRKVKPSTVILKLAAAVPCDPRTVRRYLKGEAVHPLIAEALAKLIEEPAR